MIEVINLSKSFDDKLVIDNLNLVFEKNKIYGILGINGAGKSTLLRTISAIYKADKGNVTMDNEEIFENISKKSKIFYIPDENVHFPEKNIEKCIAFYKNFYNSFDEELFNRLKEVYNINTKSDIKSFSKGMKKQAQLIISISFSPEYLILDETFDGLDPLIRTKTKKLLIDLVDEKGMCLIISTHNVSDIENLIDQLVIINNKNVIINNLDSNKFLKIQLVLQNEIDINTFGLNIKSHSQLGRVHTIIVENTNEEVDKIILPYIPVVYDIHALTKEEIFMAEVEGL